MNFIIKMKIPISFIQTHNYMNIPISFIQTHNYMNITYASPSHRRQNAARARQNAKNIYKTL